MSGHERRYSGCDVRVEVRSNAQGVSHGPHCVPVALNDSASDRELVARAQHDPDAFAVLYRRYVGRVRAFAIRRSGDVHTADDVTATVFERAWRNLDRLVVTDVGIAPWLYRIASNEITSQFRKSGRGGRASDRLALERPVGPNDPADDVLRVLDDQALRDALHRLNPRHQEVISLRYLAGLSPQETAAAMGVSPPTVAAVLHRALRALERLVEPERPEDDTGGSGRDIIEQLGNDDIGKG